MRDYQDLKIKSEKVIEDYKKFKDERYEKELLYKNCAPHIANFKENDFVINIMGINPSVPNDGSREGNYKEGIANNLDLFYIPVYDYDKKYSKYTLEDSFSRTQYNIWKNEIFENKFIKMSWQRYDKAFLTKFYKENKAEEYSKIIESINKDYKKDNIEFYENIYLIFTNLVYISHHNQSIITDFINQNEYKENINKLFYEQMNYYNSKITVIANSSASRYVKNNILNDKNIWEKITFEGEEEYLELSNLYKNKINNCFVYLTCRYFDGRVMNEFSKNLFIKEMKKILLKNINKI